MVKKDEYRSIGWLILVLAILFGAGFLIDKKGYDRGYKEGQINYSLGKIRYTVLEGKMIHFFGNAPVKEVTP